MLILLWSLPAYTETYIEDETSYTHTKTYVDANDEDEAMNKAEDIADLFVDKIEINDDKRIDESTLYFSNSCLVDEEEIDNE